MTVEFRFYALDLRVACITCHPAAGGKIIAENSADVAVRDVIKFHMVTVHGLAPKSFTTTGNVGVTQRIAVIAVEGIAA